MLDGFALGVRRLIYEAAIERSTIPLKADLAAASGASLERVEGALGELAAAHQLVLQRESGEVLMANPFSAVPTPFVVGIGARAWFANCIWDAMGIAAMVGGDAMLDASCGCCGTAMRLAIPAECRDDDERVAHFAIPAAHWWDDIVFN
jgi:Alkylmercury lyase